MRALHRVTILGGVFELDDRECHLYFQNDGSHEKGSMSRVKIRTGIKIERNPRSVPHFPATQARNAALPVDGRRQIDQIDLRKIADQCDEAFGVGE